MSSSVKQTIFVTGASGQMGKLIVAELAAKHGASHNIIVGTRNPDSLTDLPKNVTVRKTDFDHEQADIAAAFNGVDRAIIISTNSLAPGQRAVQQIKAIKAARDAGVKFVAYTSAISPFDSLVPIAHDHAITELEIFRSGMGFAILRNSLYNSAFFKTIQQATATGKWLTSAPTVAYNSVAVADCASAAVAVVINSKTESGDIYNIGSNELLSISDQAAVVTKITGKKIDVIAVDGPTYESILAPHVGPFAAILRSFDDAINASQFSILDNRTEALIGRKPQTFAEFIESKKSEL